MFQECPITCIQSSNGIMEGYVHGHRSEGRPKQRWIDGLKEDCAVLNLTIQKLEVPLKTEER